MGQRAHPVVAGLISAALLASLAPIFAGEGELPRLLDNDRGLLFALVAVLAGGAAYVSQLEPSELPVAKLLRRAWRACEAAPATGMGILVATAAGLFAWAALRRHEALQSSAFDLGIFDQVVFEVSRGHGLYSSLKGHTTLLGDHFEPILCLLGPVSRLSDGPSPLLALQAIALASAAVPLYLLARRRHGGGPLPWALPIALLGYLPLRSLALLDFHPEALAVPLLFWAVFGLETERSWLFWFCLTGASLCKESGLLAATGLGLWAWLSGRRASGALAVALFGTGFVLAVGFVIPHFHGGPNAYVGERYGYLSGGSFAGLLLSPFRHPWLCLRGVVWPPRKIEYLLRLFGPLAFLPLLRPRWLVAMAPLLAMNLLADYPQSQSIHTQYNAELIALAFAAAVDGIVWLRPKLGWSDDRLAVALVALAVAFVGTGEPFEQIATPIPGRAEQIARSLARIPREASVTAQLDLVPHLSHRDELLLLPSIGSAEYAAFDLAAPLPRWNETREANRAQATSLLAQGWVRIDGGEDYLILRRPN
ncbi:MAG: DUF2079 domain-containing protein [Deltaproteobacteria bacterium]